QITGEARATRDTRGGSITRWTPLRKRVEVLDCTVYALWLETHMELVRKSKRWWDDLENLVQPLTQDMFTEPAADDSAGPSAEKASRGTPQPAPRPRRPASRPASNGFG